MKGNIPMSQPINQKIQFSYNDRLDDVFDNIDNDIDDLFSLFLEIYNLKPLSFIERQIPKEFDREDESIYILVARDKETNSDINFHIRVVKQKLISCTIKSLLIVDLKKGDDMDGKLVVDTNNRIPECLTLEEIRQAINAIKENSEKISSFKK